MVGDISTHSHHRLTFISTVVPVWVDSMKFCRCSRLRGLVMYNSGTIVLHPIAAIGQCSTKHEPLISTQQQRPSVAVSVQRVY